MVKCIKYIDQKALDTVGIFRLSGAATQIDKYKKEFDAGFFFFLKISYSFSFFKFYFFGCFFVIL